MIEDRLSDILATLPARISDVVNPWADSSPGRPAVVETSGAWTYQQLATSIAEARVWLSESGVRPGDRVTLRLRPWTDVSDQYEKINRSEIDDPAVQLEEPCWGELK